MVAFVTQPHAEAFANLKHGLTAPASIPTGPGIIGREELALIRDLVEKGYR